jgi:phosphate:Na+ symporter
MEVTSLHLGQMAMGLFGGLAIFLFGMDQLTSSLKAVAGERMRVILEGATTNRFKGVFAGALTTAIIQSSSVTTVLVVGFVSAGLISLPQAVGVVMGAEIGTTVTAQLIAFRVTEYALIAVAVGFALRTFARNDVIQRYGTMLLGLGLVFFGMTLMGDATEPLRGYAPFVNALRTIQQPMLAVLLSAAFTALIQSSSATTGIIIVFAGQGLISLEQGIALVFGANIGTCVTALLAAVGKERIALRTALIHVLFNVFGVILWFAFIDQFAALVRVISPAAEQLAGAARLAAEVPRQIANAHTIFNVGNTLIFIGFAGGFAWLVNRLVPDKPHPTGALVAPKFLNPALLAAPSLALDAARRELVQLGEQVLPMVKAAPGAVMSGSMMDVSRLARMDERVDVLHKAIIEYLGRISRVELTLAEQKRLHDYMGIATYLENMGDIIEVNLGHAGRRRVELNVRISSATQQALQELADKITWALECTIAALDQQDRALAFEVVQAKQAVNELVEKANAKLAQRLIAEAPRRADTFQIESDLIEQLRRVYYFSKRVARLLADGEMPETQTAVPIANEGSPV